MKTYDHTWLMASVARNLRRLALYGSCDGKLESTGAYLRRCIGFHEPTGTRIIFTRDVNHHLSGWWKNPDYERCWHLSLSFLHPTTFQRAQRDKNLTRQWLEAFFGEGRKLLWCEPPYSDQGKECETWHYRLFCNDVWAPILPRGEVYTRQFTEAGWKSYSDVQADLQEAEQQAKEIEANE